MERLMIKYLGQSGLTSQIPEKVWLRTKPCLEILCTQESFSPIYSKSNQTKANQPQKNVSVQMYHLSPPHSLCKSTLLVLLGLVTNVCQLRHTKEAFSWRSFLASEKGWTCSTDGILKTKKTLGEKESQVQYFTSFPK